jgi:hypothetical protein
MFRPLYFQEGTPDTGSSEGTVDLRLLNIQDELPSHRPVTTILSQALWVLSRLATFTDRAVLSVYLLVPLLNLD